MLSRYWVIGMCWAFATLAIALGGCERMEAPQIEAGERPAAMGGSQTEINALPQLDGKATVVLTVGGRSITIRVNGNKAPVTAGNFVDLVDRGFYEGLTFHRVVREPRPLLVQGGEPPSQEAIRRHVPLELLPQGADGPIYGETFEQAGISAPPALPHERGTVSMARSQMPNSASSEFFIALADLPFLDGHYAAFGRVTEGMAAVEAIEPGDRIQSSEVVRGLERLQRP